MPPKGLVFYSIGKCGCGGAGRGLSWDILFSVGLLHEGTPIEEHPGNLTEHSFDLNLPNI